MLFFPAFGTLALSANKFRVILVPVVIVAAVFCVLGAAGFSLGRLVVLVRVVVFQRRLALACAAVVKALLAVNALAFECRLHRCTLRVPELFDLGRVLAESSLDGAQLYLFTECEFRLASTQFHVSHLMMPSTTIAKPPMNIAAITSVATMATIHIQISLIFCLIVSVIVRL